MLWRPCKIVNYSLRKPKPFIDDLMNYNDEMSSSRPTSSSLLNLCWFIWCSAFVYKKISIIYVIKAIMF